MSRRFTPGPPGIAGILLVAALVLAVTVAIHSRRSADPLIPPTAEGDVAEAVHAPELEDLPLRAEAYLASGRPWRAARLMRRYTEEVLEPTADRLLAARAEAGWGAWPAVHDLLEGVPGLDAHGSGLGLYLLARARDEGGDAAGAAAGYRAFLALSPPAGELAAERAAARLRLGLALVRGGERQAARAELTTVAGAPGDLPLWLSLLEADALARAGDTVAVREAVGGLDAGYAGLRGWRARVEAARRAGDPAAARSLADRAREWARTDATRAEFLLAAGRAALALGDDAGARAAFRSAIDRVPAGPHAREAATLLLAGGTPGPADHLAVARVYRAQGLHEESLEGYRRWLDAGIGTAEQRAAAHMEYANALFYAERYDEVPAALRPVASQTSARFLLARAEAHRGRADDAVRIYLSLADRFAGTGNGAQALLLAAGARHDDGDAEAARDLYRRLVSRYPGSGQMGLAMLRLAGIAFGEENFAEAARIWDEYRSRYPRGTRALEATYWAGRARLQAGDSTGAAALFRSVRAREPDSYYALLAARRLDEAFWPLPMAAAPPDSRDAERRVAGWMRAIDLLREAGFEEDASAEVDRVAAAAGPDRGTRYALAEALVERGYSQRAIQIGLGLQGARPPDLRLLRILYPFPFRALITAEARDRGIDPAIAAALIRQESMFEARITSHAGARGLMQIMPATGRRLAEAAGVDPWDPEVLYHPEINVHLGTRYLAQHLDHYDGSLPSVFSAYNAGSHRVAWWSEYPEYRDEELFTERIPFRETRDYVKILTRNHALYRGLYGDSGEGP